MAQSSHKRAVLLTLDKYAKKGWLVWENKTGVAWQKAGEGYRPVRYGLVGSSDIIGIRAVEITPDMVGETVGIFVGIEVKVGKDKLREQQAKFQMRVGKMGGIFIEERT